MTTTAGRPAHRASAAVHWVVGDAADRARFTDMVASIQRPVLSAPVGVVCVLSAWWYGPAQLVLSALALVTMAAGGAVGRRVRSPQLVVLAVFFALELNLAVAVLLSGGGSSPLLPLLAVPVVTQSLCLRRPVFATGIGCSATLAVLAVTLAPLLPAVQPAPVLLHLAGYLALLCTLAVTGHTIVSSDLHSRDEAVVDPMTGLFNRLTLSARFADAQRSAALTGGSVGLVMCDVDHFKSVNDDHGHDRGDQVLVELADRLRSNLRGSDMAYRVGGEEFVVLLPGRDAAAAERIAERIRSAVDAVPLAGLPITVSAGVISTAGAPATLAELLREADAALYRAKLSGRNRVVAAQPGVRSTPRPAPLPTADLGSRS